MDWETIEPRTKALIKGKIRQIFRWSKEKKDYLRIRTFKEEYRGKVRALVHCDKCGIVLLKCSKDYQLDHIIPVGRCSPEMVRLMFDKSNFQLLCTECHNEKTTVDRGTISSRELL